MQTKLKEKRSEHRDNIDVQQHQAKYSRIGSGRPVKKRIGEIAQRDRQKQAIIGNPFSCLTYCFHLQILLRKFDSETLLEMKKQAEKLRDFSQTDINEQINLWKETVHVRRQYIREHSTSDTITNFPGYSYALLVS